jgi:hypothetical protein
MVMIFTELYSYGKSLCVYICTYIQLYMCIYVYVYIPGSKYHVSIIEHAFF